MITAYDAFVKYMLSLDPGTWVRDAAACAKAKELAKVAGAEMRAEFDKKIYGKGK